ncbi:MAG: EVE domain-containing protein [Candidatus Hydrogenedentota bacterium]|nr:MAG: EVE domain-containing protein [Candidatus Hydrogenedentota bacterium]
MKYWLFKTEPNTFSWTDLLESPRKTAEWDGVRNYQARNFMMEMKKGDLGFFYHSATKIPAIMGIVEVVKEAYPDYTQFDPQSKYFDEKSTQEKPRWFMVDVKAKREFTPPITRDELKKFPQLEGMLLLKKGLRLSVLPVEKKHWDFILSLRK